MKLVFAVIQPHKLSAVLMALEDVAIERMTICDAQGYDVHQDEVLSGQHGPDDRIYRKLLIEIVVNDDFLQPAIDSLSRAAKTGSVGAVGDGKLFVVPVEEAIQLDDARRGREAV